MVCRLRKALIAVLAVMLMVLVSVSCASSDDVERYDAWPDQEEPPQDASRYGYRLIGFRLLLGYGLSTGRRVKPQKQTEPDNGLEFQSCFRAKCAELGLEHFYIHKSSPNENAVIERSFRTDEEECFFRLVEAPQHHLELNTWYQRFLDSYNTARPHMGINMLTPKPESTEGRPWGQPLKKPAGAPLNLG